MDLLNRDIGTPYPHECPEAYTKALFGDEYKPEPQSGMKQITKIITETKYDPKVIAWECYVLIASISLVAHVIEWFV